MEPRSKKLLLIIVSFFCIVLITLFVVIESSKHENYVDQTVKISSLLSASIHLAEQAGDRIVKVRMNEDSDMQARVKGHTKEGAKEYVTIGDQKSHNVIVGGLSARWPSLRYRSEESGMSMETVSTPLYDSEVMQLKKRDEEVNIKDITVWIDPLDATQEYTEGESNPELLEYVMVMICIVVDKYPVAGVLHQPFVKGENGTKRNALFYCYSCYCLAILFKDKDGREGVSYWGWVGHGVSSSLGPKKNRVREKVRVISSRSHGGNVRELAEQSYGLDNVEQTIAAGAGYKTVQVIQDKADVYLHSTKIKKWDTCAGNAIINAVGGAMTTMKGEEIDYSYNTQPVVNDGLIATSSVKQNSEFRHKLSVELQ